MSRSALPPSRPIVNQASQRVRDMSGGPAVADHVNHAASTAVMGIVDSRSLGVMTIPRLSAKAQTRCQYRAGMPLLCHFERRVAGSPSALATTALPPKSLIRRSC